MKKILAVTVDWLGGMGGVLALGVAASAGGTVVAQPVFYEFVEDGSEDVLATLELSSLPAGLAEINNLTFTPAGEAFLGLGPVYGGTFDFANVTLVDNGSGLLVPDSSGGNITDNDPPSIGVFAGQSQTHLIFTWSVFDDDGQGVSEILALADVGNDDLDIIGISFGEWRAVPEPSSLLLLGTVGLFFGSRRRRV